MLMKKSLSLILSVVMILASIVTATAAYVPDPEILPENYDIDVTVEVPSYIRGTMTAKIIHEDFANKIFGIAEDRTPSPVSGKNVYNFTMVMPADAVSGEYILVLGGNVGSPAQPYTFNYFTPSDKVKFYDGDLSAADGSVERRGLDGATADEIKSYLGSKEEYIPAAIADEYEDYKLLDTKALGLVNAAIAAEDLSTGVTLGVTDNDDVVTLVSETETKFSTLFKKLVFAAKILDIATISDADMNDWETIVEEAFDADVCGAIYDENTEDDVEFGQVFDSKYYTAPAGKTPLLAIEDVYSYFVTEVADFDTLDIAEYTVAFDKATLMLIEATKDYATLGSAFMYFATDRAADEDADILARSATIAPDMTDIAPLVSAETDADLWKGVRELGYADYVALEDKVEEIAKTMVENGALESKPAGDLGDNTTTDKPQKPGGTASVGGGSAPIKPAEPVNPTQPKPVEGFTDLANAEWSREAVEYLADKGVINGKSENTFAPNDPVTREEGAKIIVAAFDLLTDSECDFTDVAKDRWSYAYIAAAVEAGIITGYGDDFGPTDTMTREQAATIIFRAAEKIALEISGDKAEFDDDEHSSDWAKDAIAHLAADGVINGMGDGTFAPKATLTRAQLAQLVYNVLVLIGGVK